jgi:glyoxylase-like metal-dependent hydrolase (beta-lactamase superfamily II)
VLGLEENGLSIADVRRVILTHKHIDHIGNAWRIQQESAAQILIHEHEMQSVGQVDPDGERFKELVRRRLDGWQVPRDALPRDSSSSGRRWDIESCEPTALGDGQRLSQGDGELEIIHTPGHTMGSICIKHGPCLFSGDHVLRDISPNVGGGDMRRQGMLGHYLGSLQRIVDEVESDVHVSPGHGDPFIGLHPRCRELLEHHQERLNNVIEILQRDSDQTVYEIARQLFGEMKDYHVVLGCAEAAAHLEYLEHEGRVTSGEGRYRLA